MCDVGSALTDITLQNYKKIVTLSTLCCDPGAGTAAVWGRHLPFKIIASVTRLNIEFKKKNSKVNWPVL